MKKYYVLFLTLFIMCFFGCTTTESVEPVVTPVTITNKCEWAISLNFIYPQSYSLNAKNHKFFKVGREPVTETVVTGKTLRIFMKTPYDSFEREIDLKNLEVNDSNNKWEIGYSTYNACYYLKRGEETIGF